MIKTQSKVSYKDYFALPEGDTRQLIGGRFVDSPSPSTGHQEVLLRLLRKLLQLEDRGFGKPFCSPIDLYLSETEVFQPDLLFISKDNVSIIKEQYIRGAPDLIMEVLSPGTAYYDLRHKKEVYQRSGVSEYWIVDPLERSIELFSKNPDQDYALSGMLDEGKNLSSSLFPELEYSWGEVFGFPGTSQNR